MLPWFRLWMTGAAIAAEAQAVIAMRLLGAAGLWRLGKGERQRMVAEKARAGQRSAVSAWTAAMRGQGAAEILEAAAKPVRRATRANVRRLKGGSPLVPRRPG
ncbi:MAG: antifreeze protein [Gemmobacter sp.]